MTDNSKIEELRRLAEAATPGPWRMEHMSISAHIHQVDGLHGLASCVIGYGNWDEPKQSEGAKNASFIAAANPATIIALLDELDASKAMVRKLYQGYVNTLEAGRDRILALGGQCDSVEVMEEFDPVLRAARAFVGAEGK